MGPAVYDSRIRPAGINGTGEGRFQLKNAFVFSFLKGIQLVYWLSSHISVFDINYECDCSELNIRDMREDFNRKTHLSSTS